MPAPPPYGVSSTCGAGRGPVAQVVHAQVEQPARARLADAATGRAAPGTRGRSRRRRCARQSSGLGATRLLGDRPGSRRRTRAARPAGRARRGRPATSTSGRSPRRTAPACWRRRARARPAGRAPAGAPGRRPRPARAPSTCYARQPDELVVVPGVGPRRRRRRVDDEHRSRAAPRRRCGRRPPRTARTSGPARTRVPTRPSAGRARPGSVQHDPAREARLRVVGPQVQGDLAAQAVRPRRCGRTRTAKAVPSGLRCSASVDVDDVDADAPAVGERADRGCAAPWRCGRRGRSPGRGRRGAREPRGRSPRGERCERRARRQGDRRSP